MTLDTLDVLRLCATPELCSVCPNKSQEFCKFSVCYYDPVSLCVHSMSAESQDESYVADWVWYWRIQLYPFRELSTFPQLASYPTCTSVHCEASSFFFLGTQRWNKLLRQKFILKEKLRDVSCVKFTISKRGLFVVYLAGAGVMSRWQLTFLFWEQRDLVCCLEVRDSIKVYIITFPEVIGKRCSVSAPSFVFHMYNSSLSTSSSVVLPPRLSLVFCIVPSNVIFTYGLNHHSTMNDWASWLFPSTPWKRESWQ